MSAALKIDLPAPPIPADADLRHFQTMPLDVQRFRDSDLCCVEDPEVRWANVMSWSVAWHQLPAGSLPDDDVALCRLLGYGSQVKKWRRLRTNGALRGWVLCSDGRLYHPVVTEMALECLEKSRAQAKKARQRWSPTKPQVIEIPQDPECRGNASPEEPAMPLKGIEGNRRDNPIPLAAGEPAECVSPWDDPSEQTAANDLFDDGGQEPVPKKPMAAEQAALLEAARLAWNEIAGAVGRPNCLELSPARKRMLTARLREDLGNDIDRWRNYVRSICSSSFLRGENPSWTKGASFDWAIEKRNLLKVREGQYRDKDS